MNVRWLFVWMLPLPLSGQISVVDTGQFPGTLTPWESAKIEQRLFLPDDCSVLEGCADVGVRRLLSFHVTIYNPSVLTNGQWSGTTNSTYVYDECHHHYHMVDFSLFLLLDCDGLIVSARKMGWCVRNWYRLIDLYATNYTTNEVSGIITTNVVMWNLEPSIAGCVPPKFDPGWSDTYSGAQPCMWFDVTDVPDGDYLMWIEIDPLRKLNAHYLATHAIRLASGSVSVIESLNCEPMAPTRIRMQ